MTDDQINIAIAEWCGWKWCKVIDSEFGNRWTLQYDYFRSGALSPNSPIAVHYIVKDTLTEDDKRDHQICNLGPKYTEDLNAMHEAEKKLGLTYHRVNVPLIVMVNEANLYRKKLREICERDGNNHTIHATARQRAEALLRTIGKWVE